MTSVTSKERQLELEIGKGRVCRSGKRKLSPRQYRAHQWFDKMREAVENAHDYAPAPEERWDPHSFFEEVQPN